MAARNQTRWVFSEVSNWNQSDDFDDDDQSQQQQAPKALRQHASKLEKENADLRKEVSELKAATRKNVIADVLRARDVDSRVAGLVPADVEATPEAVEKWLADHADLFPTKPQQSSTEAAAQGDDSEGDEGSGEEDPADVDFAARMGRLAQATSGAQSPTKQADMMALVNGAKSREDLDRMVEAAGGGYGSG